MKKSNVYTRTGDQGMTSLVGGERVSKTSPRLEAYGTVDELNSQLGLLITYVKDDEEAAFLTQIQSNLFSLSAYLATDQSTTQLREQSVVTDEMIAALEKRIDLVDSQLPVHRHFVLPGGARGAAVCHVCRTVCRRAERRIIALAAEAPVDERVTAYINRLSDFLFVFARHLNLAARHEEVFWKKN